MENFTLLLKKYADFIVRVGVNPQPGQTLVINCCLEAAPLARLCVRSAYEAGARDVLVNWSDNDISRSRMELGSEEALTDFKSYQLRRYLDYAESEGGVCVLHILADDPEVYAPIRLGIFALMRPVITLTEGLCVAIIRCIPAALAPSMRSVQQTTCWQP